MEGLAAGRAADCGAARCCKLRNNNAQRYYQFLGCLRSSVPAPLFNSMDSTKRPVTGTGNILGHWVHDKSDMMERAFCHLIAAVLKLLTNLLKRLVL